MRPSIPAARAAAPRRRARAGALEPAKDFPSRVRSCTGFFDYDSYSLIPCKDEYFLGRVLMQNATELRNDVDPQAETSRRRGLTPSEKTIARENGLGLTENDLMVIEVVNAGAVIEGHPEADCAVFSGSPYEIHCTDSVYPSVPADLMLHELVHVTQFLYGWPYSSSADWQLDENGDVLTDKRYVYRDPDSTNTEQRELLYDEFSDYTQEQQAELLRDRWKACALNQLEANDVNKTKDDDDFIHNGRIDPVAYGAYVKRIYDSIDGITGIPADSRTCFWETVQTDFPVMH